MRSRVPPPWRRLACCTVAYRYYLYMLCACREHLARGQSSAGLCLRGIFSTFELYCCLQSCVIRRRSCVSQSTHRCTRQTTSATFTTRRRTQHEEQLHDTGSSVHCRFARSGTQVSRLTASTDAGLTLVRLICWHKPKTRRRASNFGHTLNASNVELHSQRLQRPDSAHRRPPYPV